MLGPLQFRPELSTRAMYWRMDPGKGSVRMSFEVSQFSRRGPNFARFPCSARRRSRKGPSGIRRFPPPAGVFGDVVRLTYT